MLKKIDSKIKNKKILVLTPLSLLFLKACGGGGDNQQVFSGFVIKGPLSNANVFADIDGDGIQGANEPSAITDAGKIAYTFQLQETFQQLL